jgi:hypothetical protein
MPSKPFYKDVGVDQLLRNLLSDLVERLLIYPARRNELVQVQQCAFNPEEFEIWLSRSQVFFIVLQFVICLS